MAGFGDLHKEEAAAESRFDKQAFARYLREKALPPFGNGQCAHYVREALRAGGLNVTGAPVPAKNYGPFLMSRLFSRLPKQNYQSEVGDIAVIDCIPGHSYGHVQGWDGKNWISDFVQPLNFYPGHVWEKARASYEIYRR